MFTEMVLSLGTLPDDKMFGHFRNHTHVLINYLQ